VTVVALGAVRSSGATTLAAATAACWPADRKVLLVELDPAGGTLAAASGWPPEPGLVSLAAAARRHTDPNLIWEHCQVLPGGAAVLAGPVSAERARSSLTMLEVCSSGWGNCRRMCSSIAADSRRPRRAWPLQIRRTGWCSPFGLVSPTCTPWRAGWRTGRWLLATVSSLSVTAPIPTVKWPTPWVCPSLGTCRGTLTRQPGCYRCRRRIDG